MSDGEPGPRAASDLGRGAGLARAEPKGQAWGMAAAGTSAPPAAPADSSKAGAGRA